MEKRLLTFIGLVLGVLFNMQAQCNPIETISVCDMTVIDGLPNGAPDGVVDGVINLYDAFNAQAGTTLTLADGSWNDPNFNFALDQTTGDLYLWDLDNASEADTDYQFEFINPTSGCPDDVQYVLNVIVGPYSGTAASTSAGGVNLQVCLSGPPAECDPATSIDLFATLLSNPSPHSNGTWTYTGTSSSFIGVVDGRFLSVNVPYVPGPPLVDEETFEMEYTVPGITPCAPEQVTTVTVTVVREPFAGFGNSDNICETELLAGAFDGDIDLLGDNFLVNENIEGVWLTDTAGEISGPGDSVINLRSLYDDLIATNPRFGCQTYDFTYLVESRSTVCSDQETDVSFTFYEYIRPFSQDATIDNEFCVGDDSLTSINLYDYIEFTTENINGSDVVFDYPNDSCTNWRFISGPSDLGLVTNTGDICDLLADPGYTSAGTIDLSNLDTNLTAGTYVFEYTVAANYHCDALPEETFDAPDGCTSSTNTNHPCTGESTQVTIIVHPINYAGEDTAGLEFCESEGPLVLTDLLATNSIDDPVYVGPEGTWLDAADGSTILNDFVFPDITDLQVFNFEYNTITSEGCVDIATLSFTVYEQYSAGTGGAQVVCNDGATIDLFTLLTDDPSANGTWTGPGGFTSPSNVALFDPATGVTGDYVYTVPANGTCPGASTTLSITVEDLLYAGEDTAGLEFCFEELGDTVDLISLLETNGTDTVYTGAEGVFTDAMGTIIINPLTILDVVDSELFEFTYTTTTANGCVDTATLSFTVYEQYNAGSDVFYEICPDGVAVDLFTLLDTDTDTNGTWTGPNGYFTTSNTAFFDPAMNAEGDYIYAIAANGVCDASSSTVTVAFYPINYAGEDTSGVEICVGDTDGTIDLRTLLDTNGTDDVYTGTNAIWTDASGTEIDNPFVIPAVNGSLTLNLTYTTSTLFDCEDTATLEVTFYEQFTAGDDVTQGVCPDGAPFDLYDVLDNPTTTATGSWTGPGGFAATGNTAIFDPLVNEAGDYIFTLPANGTCPEDAAIVTVSFFDVNYAGEDTFDLELCQGDFESGIGLVDLLETNGNAVYEGPEGVWTETATGVVITDPLEVLFVDGSLAFDLTYTTTTENGCEDSSQLTFTLWEAVNAGGSTSIEVCTTDGTFNLFNLLLDDPDNTGSWTGPDGYTSSTNEALFVPGTDVSGVYTYTVPANGACEEEIATVTVTYTELNYAGEDTTGAMFCVSSEGNVVDLTTLLETNGVDAVYTGPNANWIDLATGLLVDNPFTIPDFDTSISFSFEYTTATDNGCTDQAILNWTASESFEAGTDATFDICISSEPINLFNILGGSPETNGTWTGPNGYTATGTSATMDPTTDVSGDYVYTTPENGACEGLSATISVTVEPLVNAGEDIVASICPGNYTFDLNELLDPTTDQGGNFVNLDTGETVVDGVIDVAVFGSGTFAFTYIVAGLADCDDDIASISLEVETVNAPSVEVASFCISEAATLNDLTVNTNESNFEWYESLSSTTPLALNTLLVDDVTYFVAAVNDNGCESTRTPFTADILSLSESVCDDGIPDGVSVNNDGVNDTLDISNLAQAFPRYTIQIFNRYGNTVYNGNSTVPPFDGTSNAGVTLGDDLPTGVYFYIFNPNDGETQPFNGNFYLSR